MTPAEINEAARILDQATLHAQEMPKLSDQFLGLDLPNAYKIQEAGIRLRNERGEKFHSLKMGFTSAAKRTQMGLGAPIYGVLTDRMQVMDGGSLSLKDSIHPKIEPEIAFRIAKPFGAGVSALEALASCSHVAAALEILDSRYLGFKYFSLPDVVADNCSSSRFVISSQPQPVSAFGLERLAQLSMEMRVNGQPSTAALASEISGNPANSLVQLAALMAERGLTVPAGAWVLAGAATQAVTLAAGMRVECRVEGLGQVQVTATA